MKRSITFLVVLAALISLALSPPPPLGSQRKLPPDITSVSALENFDYVWERIRDTHFDPTFNGVDWYAVREELRPRAAECRHIDSLRAVIWNMLGRLGQSHFGLIPSDRYESAGDDAIMRRILSAIPDDVARPGPGIDVRPIDGAVVVTEVWEHGDAVRAGVRPGWELVSIDGERCDELLARFEEAVRALQGADWLLADMPYIVWAVIEARMAGEEGSMVDLVFRDASGGEVAVAVERRACPWPLDTVAGMPSLPVRVESRAIDAGDGHYRVGYLAVHFFWLPGTVAAVEDAVRALPDCDAFVIDIRGNLGGVSLAMQAVASYFTAESITMGRTVGRDGEMPVMAHPRRIGVRGDRVRPFTGPVALLTDNLSGSASELFAAGLKDAGRARVFGTATAGAALPAIISEMPNGDRLLHATFDFIRTNGESLEGSPLEPHVTVPATREGLARGEDAALEAALAWLTDKLETGGTP